MKTGVSSPTPETREEILGVLSRQIRDLEDRMERHDVQTPEGRDEHRRDLRSLCAVVREYRLLQRDTDIDVIQDDLELLQRTSERRGWP